MEFLLIFIIVAFIILYRKNTGAITYKFIVGKVEDVYDKFAPYSFKNIREKVKELGMEYSAKQYTIQVIIFAGGAFIVSYLYFYSIVVSIVYAFVAVFAVKLQSLTLPFPPKYIAPPFVAEFTVKLHRFIIPSPLK